MTNRSLAELHNNVHSMSLYLIKVLSLGKVSYKYRLHISEKKKEGNDGGRLPGRDYLGE